MKEVRYDEVTKKFTVIIENETFEVDLDGNYIRKNMTINITKEKTEEGIKVTVKVTSKQEIESIEIIKDGSSTSLNVNKNDEEYTTEKVVTEEGTYQVKVRTETGEEETINIMIDLGGPQIEHSYNTETNTINMKVTDAGSGIKKIEVYSQVSTTETGAITESKVEEFNYEDSPKEKEEASKVTNIPFGGYLRGYKIIAEDADGNTRAEEHTFNPPIQSYIIMNEAQLKSFRDAVNGGNNFSGKIVYLGADIELNKGKYTLDETGKIPTFASDAEQWTPINYGLASGRQFEGTFDGKGHCISGMYVSNVDDPSFFGSCDKGATIKNLGIIHSAIQNDTVGSYVGGIVAQGGNSSSTRVNVEDCFFSGIINVEKSDSNVGGIASRWANVSRCYFDGVIISKGPSVGGIICSGNPEDCFAKGSVTARSSCGGITGNGLAKNSYNVARVSSYNIYPVSNSQKNSNCFFLKGICSQNTTLGGTEEVEEAYMKSDEFVTALNAGRDIWTRDNNINDGYPILKNIKYRR